jgi:cystathionine gamma-lyase
MSKGVTMKFATKAIRVGQAPDPHTGSIAVPVYQTANFIFDDVGQPHSYEYSRSGNPTRGALEACLASLEEGAHGLAFASGMAAVDAVLSLLKPGDHVVSAVHVYGGTSRLFEDVYKPRGIRFTYVDGTDTEAFGRALEPTTALVWIETPANPLLQLVDVRGVAAQLVDHPALLVADNTFASPYFQRPLTQGADIVMHSTTKYVGGHSDVIGGAVVVKDAALNERLYFHQNSAGAVPGPWDCWLTLRGIKTLAVRMRQHQESAQAIATMLEAHSKVVDVFYPGLESHPQHALALSQMSGFGAIITFRIDGGVEAVRRFVKAAELFLFAESLGGVESLVCHPATMSHAVVPEPERVAAGITDGTLRLSVGIEDVTDLLADLENALAAV